jgi:hypothetical protein
MTDITISPEAARFLRTLRVATATTLAAADLVGASRSRSTTSFLALAAKGVDDWRFPTDGLLSADGLVRATLVKEPDAQTLVLQALGAAGLTRYAGVSAQVNLTSGVELAGAFDRDGALRLPLQAEIAETDLAGFDIELAGEPL